MLDKPFIKKSGRVIIEGNRITVEDFEVDYQHPACDGCHSVAIAGTEKTGRSPHP